MYTKTAYPKEDKPFLYTYWSPGELGQKACSKQKKDGSFRRKTLHQKTLPALLTAICQYAIFETYLHM